MYLFAFDIRKQIIDKNKKKSEFVSSEEYNNNAVISNKDFH